MLENLIWCEKTNIQADYSHIDWGGNNKLDMARLSL